MVYSSQGPISRKRCSSCGSEFVESCNKCNSPIPSKFSSPFYFTSGKPVNPPKRPDFCTECGEPFPWYKLSTDKEETVLDSTKVFVVHGRNALVRDAMFQFLRAVGLKPIEWSQATALCGKGSPFVGEILETAFKSAQAVVVIISGDDEAKLRKEFLLDSDPNYEKKFTPQARPNVLFEAGMAFGFHPDRTILVEVGKSRPFSDMAGRHTVRLDNSTQRRQDLARRLKTAGCSVELSGSDWHSVGDFEKCVPTYQPTLSGDLKYKAPFYYKEGDSIPYCPFCYETECKRIHLNGPHDIPGEKPFFKCMNCNNNF